MPNYLLLGEKLSHSYSPLIHSLLGNDDYALRELAPGELVDFLRERNFRGANVTIPYKVQALPFCDALSPEAEALGNVNTLVVEENGTLTGHNTDLYGILYMIARNGIEIKHKKVAILGSGGAARTAQSALLYLGARDVSIISRHGNMNYKRLYMMHDDIEVILNATPVGMYPRHAGDNPIDLDKFPHVTAVLDLIYNPNQTALLTQARVRGIRYENGLSMLVAQAAHAHELFTGERVPLDKIDTIVHTLRANLLNLVLIGMPGCGKSSIGREVAALMQREFVDIDEEIVRTAGMSIPDLFTNYGEPHFRDLEREAITSVSSRRGIVIATGGGAVLDRENVNALQSNGVIAFVTRALESLSTSGRPLSSGLNQAALREMLDKREPFYVGAADFSIHNQYTLANAAHCAKDGFYEAAHY